MNTHDAAARGDLHLPAARPRGRHRHADGAPTAAWSRASCRSAAEARETTTDAIAAGQRAVHRRGGAARRVHDAGRQHPAGRAGHGRAHAGRSAVLSRTARRCSGSRSWSPRATSRARRWAASRPATASPHDTDAVPDASRITPPVLLPGFPNPVRLSIDVGVDPGGLPLGASRSSLHAVSDSATDGWRIAAGRAGRPRLRPAPGLRRPTAREPVARAAPRRRRRARARSS